MRVFISWSKSRSKFVAGALRDWLPQVLQSVEPWLSANDIDKGARWLAEISASLEDCGFGILCLTPENLSSGWIHFEAGALSKSVQNSAVVPYLFDVSVEDVTAPLSQFNAAPATQEGTLRMVESINAFSAKPLDSDVVRNSFDKWWPELEQKLREVPTPEVNPPDVKRGEREILTEILETVRAGSRTSNLWQAPVYNPDVSDIFPRCSFASPSGESYQGKIKGVTRIPGGRRYHLEVRSDHTGATREFSFDAWDPELFPDIHPTLLSQMCSDFVSRSVGDSQAGDAH